MKTVIKFIQKQCDALIYGFIGPFAMLYIIPQFFIGIQEKCGWHFAPSQAQAVVGSTLMWLGAAIAMWCSLLMHFHSKNSPNPFLVPTRVVQKGPYWHVRRPMMWSITIVIVGEAIAWYAPLLIVWQIIWRRFGVLFVEIYEEPFLIRTLGEQYRLYTKRTPRWLPSFRSLAVQTAVICACSLSILFGSMTLNAQEKTDVFNSKTPIVWLGLDFTQAVYIGIAMQFKESGTITNSAFKDKYIPAWNHLFISEQKKYNVAEAVRRSSVQYATNITERTNAAITKDFFSDNPEDFKKLTKGKIRQIVKKYDFQGETGVGLLFFIEGISKERQSAAAWVTLVNMQSHTVLYAVYESGKPGGFGFRNYWAKSFFNILQQFGNDYKSWSRSNVQKD